MSERREEREREGGGRERGERGEKRERETVRGERGERRERERQREREEREERESSIVHLPLQVLRATTHLSGWPSTIPSTLACSTRPKLPSPAHNNTIILTLHTRNSSTYNSEQVSNVKLCEITKEEGYQ